MPDEVQIYNYTIFELFTQYNLFLIIMTLILAVVVVISNNHALIQQRKHDMAVMKAVGSDYRHLYSFYMNELFFLVGISFAIGWFLGFITFLLVVLSIAPFIPTVIWFPDRILSILLFISLMLATFIFNGWEIRRIGSQSYIRTQSGKIDYSVRGKLSKFVKNLVRNWSPSGSYAIKNLLRKKAEFRQSVTILAIAGTIMLTGLVGVFVVDTSVRTYINQAQGENIIAIGHNSVVSAFSGGYTKFADPSVPDLKKGDYTNEAFNLSQISQPLSQILQTYQIQSWESRIFTVETVGEVSGYMLQEQVSGSLEYVTIGGDEDTRVIPLQGVDYKTSVQNWYYEGAIVNLQFGIIIGDTFAGEIYENPYMQGARFSSLKTNRTYFFKIQAVVLDSLNNGNSAYITVLDMEECLGMPGYRNMILIDYSPIKENGDYSKLIAELTEFIAINLGQDFVVKDMQPIFRANQQVINAQESATLTISILMAMLIIFVLYQFQIGRIHEDKRDMLIFKAIGGTKSQIQNSIFIQQICLLFIGLLTALMLSMFIILFFLLPQSPLPSEWVPLGFFGLLFMILAAISYANSRYIYKKKMVVADIEIFGS
jgi:ABC-type antimicrobial peptide transport system permease subunit